MVSESGRPGWSPHPAPRPESRAAGVGSSATPPCPWRPSPATAGPLPPGMGTGCSRTAWPLAWVATEPRPAAGGHGPSRRGCAPVEPDVDHPGCPTRSASAARMNSRSRRCGAPTSDARTHVHDPTYPRPARSATTRDAPRPRCPGTFSSSTHRGRRTRTARAMSGQIQRSSSIPWRLPAAENGWHGYPAAIRSTGSHAVNWAVVMSPTLGTSGWWAARTVVASWSVSAYQVSSTGHPAACMARWSPPYPAHSSASLTVHPRR
jgi:hypothetical protein